LNKGKTCAGTGVIRQFSSAWGSRVVHQYSCAREKGTTRGSFTFLLKYPHLVGNKPLGKGWAVHRQIDAPDILDFNNINHKKGKSGL
jgi:hypothetical protein